MILLSKEDKRQLEMMAGKEIDAAIIPIGVNDPQWQKEVRVIDDELRILFLGTLTWAPNNDGMIWFLENVMPQLSKWDCSIKLFIVGKNPSEKLKTLAKRNKNVIVTGYVDSVEEYYRICDLMIVPLFFGSGQRVKIIEGFAHGMPVISTKIGAEGLEYENGINIMIANDSISFLDGIKELRNVSVRKKLSVECRKNYLDYYSPKVIENLINGVLEKL